MWSVWKHSGFKERNWKEREVRLRNLANLILKELNSAK